MLLKWWPHWFLQTYEKHRCEWKSACVNAAHRICSFHHKHRDEQLISTNFVGNLAGSNSLCFFFSLQQNEKLVNTNLFTIIHPDLTHDYSDTPHIYSYKYKYEPVVRISVETHKKHNNKKRGREKISCVSESCAFTRLIISKIAVRVQQQQSSKQPSFKIGNKKKSIEQKWIQIWKEANEMKRRTSNDSVSLFWLAKSRSTYSYAYSSKMCFDEYNSRRHVENTYTYINVSEWDMRGKIEWLNTLNDADGVCGSRAKQLTVVSWIFCVTSYILPRTVEYWCIFTSRMSLNLYTFFAIFRSRICSNIRQSETLFIRLRRISKIQH